MNRLFRKNNTFNNIGHKWNGLVGLLKSEVIHRREYKFHRREAEKRERNLFARRNIKKSQLYNLNIRGVFLKLCAREERKFIFIYCVRAAAFRSNQFHFYRTLSFALSHFSHAMISYTNANDSEYIPRTTIVMSTKA